MRVFATGATGFIGTELVRELLTAGHEVYGLSRSAEGAEKLKAAGATPVRGTVEDLDLLRKSATGMDAVVHLAFNHDDMTKFAESGQAERLAIEALGSVLEPGKLLAVTSGVAMAAPEAGQIRKESDPPQRSVMVPRQPEDTARAIAEERGLRAAVVRLPQVHDTRKQGLVTYLIEMARRNGFSGYMDEGRNRWAAAPLADVARLYRLVVEQAPEGVTTYHAVGEEGVPLREIAESIAQGLGVPSRSVSPEEAGQVFGWMGHFAGLDMPASSEWTRRTLHWHPDGPGLIDDLGRMTYA